ncbi:MAG: zinc-binding alcohol dehydrogenase [Chloroflexota bacterium]|nr:zinc-binding alcohol dehydrogenase [Chloroflexota bacterium]
MPRELVAIAPRVPILRPYDEAPLDRRQIRIRTELASPKHGTELVGYRADPAASRPYDPALGAVMHRPATTAGAAFPRRLGNMAVGVVTDLGSEASRFKVGDRVFGHFPIRETQTTEETNADPLPAGLGPEAAVCLDPAVMALPIRDAPIKLGDEVAVFGLGAIGLMAVQLARLAGAARVIAVDPLPNRRQLARGYGADLALDPAAAGGDVGLAIRRHTGRGFASAAAAPRRIIGGYLEEASQASQLGVDVAVETSGSIPALHQAIRATRFGGTVAVVSFYGGGAPGLFLGDEFHINRPRLVSVRAQSLPPPDAPGWTLERLVELALAWLTSGTLQTAGMITPIVPFAESVEAYREIDEHPERSIKLGISFD